MRCAHDLPTPFQPPFQRLPTPFQLMRRDQWPFSGAMVTFDVEVGWSTFGAAPMQSGQVAKPARR